MMGAHMRPHLLSGKHPSRTGVPFTTAFRELDAADDGVEIDTNLKHCWQCWNVALNEKRNIKRQGIVYPGDVRAREY